MENFKANYGVRRVKLRPFVGYAVDIFASEQRGVKLMRHSSSTRLITKIGIAMAAFGLLLFLFMLYNSMSHLGDFRNFESRVRYQGKGAVLGMGLFAFGGFLIAIGAGRRRRSGTSSLYREYDDGRGRDYDPNAPTGLQRPNDPAFDNFESSRPQQTSERAVRVRCRSCASVNDEAWNYCNCCGAPL